MNDDASGFFVYPDPITHPGMLSGASFLYFQKPLILTLPPQVILEEPYNLLELIQRRQPAWSGYFLNLFNAWRIQQEAFRKTFTILEPLKERCFKLVWTVYNANSKALEDSLELIKSRGKTIETVAPTINPSNAAGEIIRHIMMEAFLELGQNIERLYEYCGTLFTEESIEKLLVKGYLLRIKLLSQIGNTVPIMLTNEAIWNLLFDKIDDDITSVINDDIIAWEFFRHIISPRIDPLDNERVEIVIKLLETRKEQITKLRLKCLSLAEKVKGIKSLGELPLKVEQVVKDELENEIAEVLELDSRALKEFFITLFSDEKTWLATLSFIAGVISGNLTITTGGALGAISSIGAKTVKTVSNMRDKLRKTDYALVYTLSRQIPTNLETDG